MTGLQEEIRTAVREELRAFREELLREVRGGSSEDLTTVPRAAKACGLHPVTVRRQYLAKLRTYGKGRMLRISVAELRRAMAEDSAVDVDARAAEIRKGRRQ